MSSFSGKNTLVVFPFFKKTPSWCPSPVSRPFLPPNPYYLTSLRISWESRVETKAADHDFSDKNTPTVTPVGIFLPDLDELFLYGVTSKVTSDCLVDRLIQCWE